MVKLLTSLMGMFILFGCASTDDKSGPPDSTEYLHYINKKLKPVGMFSVKKPEVHSIVSGGYKTTTSTVCSINSIADDGEKVSFHWSRYCTMRGGNFKNTRCLSERNRVIFTTNASFTENCSTASGEPITKRVLTITEPLNQRDDSSSTNGIERRLY